MRKPTQLDPARRATPVSLIAITLSATLMPGAALALNIHFDYSFDSNNFFDTQAKKDVLENAAAFFETRITDTLSAIQPGTPNTFTAIFSDPGTGSNRSVVDLTVPADTLIVYVGGRSLSGNTLGQGGPGGYSVGGTSAFIDTAITRGQGTTADDVRNPRDGSGNVIEETAVEFAPWGGALTFDTDADANWYFDPDVTTDADIVGNDFYSVALHELGHLLGLGTADSWSNQVVNGTFTGSAATAANNGANVPVQAGGGHWAEGTQSTLPGTTTQQEAAMDPSITTGTRKRFTELDLAGLQDVGWDVQGASAQ